MFLKINKIIEENSDIKTFVFKKGNIKFKPGQFLRYTFNIQDPRGNYRSFSVASSPTENFLMISTKISESPFKQMLDMLKISDEIEATGPYGNFVLDEHGRRILHHDLD
ncbi:MAG: FAD-binding oxidoreductase, partial [Nanoarchaeota archaeon]